jgi:hypothetical protein
VANKEGQPNEHSLLVSGHFDQPHLFKSAVGGGAAAISYRSIPVLEIQPLAREHGKFKHVRWLAVLDSSVLVFGSVASAQLELDRFLAQDRPDESLVRRLSRLRSKDQTWCLLSASSPRLPSLMRSLEVQAVLAEVNPELARLAQSGNELEVGLYFGRHVEFEYEVTLASPETGRDSAEPVRQARAEPSMTLSLMPELTATRDATSLHGLIQISMSHYNAWLASIRGGRSRVD